MSEMTMNKKIKHPLLSLVIPCYNEENYLQRCIDSLLKQTYTPFEIIFIDDGSKDTTPEILLHNATKHKNIRFYKQKNQGPGAARNNGANKAKGSILIFVDADMVFDKNYLRDLTKPVLTGKYVGTCHDTELVKNIENIWARTWCLNRIPKKTEYTGVFRAIKKSAFEKSDGFNPKKGYFDDALVGAGPSKQVRAVCYHNNPESLGEAFKHSQWVGRSLLSQDSMRKKFLLLGIAALIGFIVLVILLFKSPLWSGILLGAGLFLFLLFVAKRDLPRVFAEKRPELLITAPILWAVRMTGYFVGLVKEFFVRH